MQINEKILIFSFLCFFSNIKAQCPPARHNDIHVVRKGETLFRIASRYGLSVDELCRINNISKDAPLKECQQLAIKPSAAQSATSSPSKKSANPMPSRPATTPLPAGSGEHVVRPGETIESIAALYGYTVERFRQFNQLASGEKLIPGRVLRSTDCECPDPLKATPNPAEITSVVTYDFMPDSDPAPESVPAPPTENAVAKHDTRVSTTPFYDHFTDTWIGQTTDNTPAQTSAASTPTIPAEYSSSADIKPRAGNVPLFSPTWLSAEETALLNEINQFRFDPPAWSKHVENHLQQIRASASPVAIQSCLELIAELQKTPYLEVLHPSECLFFTGKRYIESKRTLPDGTDTDHSKPWDRIRNNCIEMADGNEIYAMYAGTARQILIHLLTDDNTPSQYRRRTLLNPIWNKGSVARSGALWVISVGR